MSERDNWTHLIPVPAKAVELIRNGRNFPPWDPAWGNPKNWWLYELPDCTAIGLVVRFEKSNAEGKIKKSIIPLSYGYGSDGRSRWRWKGFPVPHPLYNLPMLTKHADAPVLIVEGEKCALALSEVQTVFVATTWPGGAKAISKADFTPLAKRAIYLWPENDDPGHAALRTVALTLRKLGCRLLRVQQQVNWPKKHDVADLLESGWSGPQVVEYIKAHSTEIAARELDETAVVPNWPPCLPSNPTDDAKPRLRLSVSKSGHSIRRLRSVGQGTLERQPQATRSDCRKLNLGTRLLMALRCSMKSSRRCGASSL